MAPTEESGRKLTGLFAGVGCVSCECNVNGTSDASCDQTTGQCICHEAVEGEQCNSCKDGFYGLATLGHCTGRTLTVNEMSF